MILRGAEANRYFATPDPARAGLLLFGADPMRVAIKRAEVVAALIGPDGAAEMRLSRLPAAELRKDPAALDAAVREIGFFPGPRVALVEEAADGLAPLLQAALADWRAGDAHIIVTAGNLTGKSALKTLFEKHPRAVAIGLYDDPPGRDEIEAELRRAGLSHLPEAAMTDLVALARALEPGDFRQLLEKIALYKFGDSSALTPAEIAALAPATLEAGIDDLIHAAAEGHGREIGPLFRRLEGQGVAAVTLCIGALRHFRALHMAVSDPGGVQAGLMRAKVFGPRRDRMQRQAGQWGQRGLEAALALLVDTDLSLRSASRAPAMAVMERAMIRLAMLRR
jgi:DNA polymerase-3 subunit delta